MKIRVKLRKKNKNLAKRSQDIPSSSPRKSKTKKSAIPVTPVLPVRRGKFAINPKSGVVKFTAIELNFKKQKAKRK